MCLFWYLPFEDNIVNRQTILYNDSDTFDTKPQIDNTGTTGNRHLMIIKPQMRWIGGSLGVFPLSISSCGSAVFGSGAEHPRWRNIQHRQGRCLIVSNMFTV